MLPLLAEARYEDLDAEEDQRAFRALAQWLQVGDIGLSAED